MVLVWLMLSYGLMTIMVYGSIFQGLRDWVKRLGNSGIPIIGGVFNFIHGIISCPLCFSFHGGWFLSLVIFSPMNHLFGVSNWTSWFFDGIFSSGSVWAINSIVEWFEENRPAK